MFTSLPSEYVGKSDSALTRPAPRTREDRWADMTYPTPVVDVYRGTLDAMKELGLADDADLIPAR